jgi:uncharacterized membrane protein YqjE
VPDVPRAADPAMKTEIDPGIFGCLIGGLLTIVWIAFGICAFIVSVTIVVPEARRDVATMAPAFYMLPFLATALVVMHSLRSILAAVRGNAEATAEALRRAARERKGAEES